MPKIYVASRNAIKLEEIQRICSDAVPFDFEMTEIQSPDPVAVVRQKLEQVVAADVDAPVIVEDTGLAVSHWKQLPGALIKWFVEELGPDRLSTTFLAEGPTAATATSAVGAAFRGEVRIWSGQTKGRIVAPRGDLGGWTPIFEVHGSGKTLAEMDLDERMHYTMRAEPLRYAREWIEQFH